MKLGAAADALAQYNASNENQLNEWAEPTSRKIELAVSELIGSVADLKERRRLTQATRAGSQLALIMIETGDITRGRRGQLSLAENRALQKRLKQLLAKP